MSEYYLRIYFLPTNMKKFFALFIAALALVSCENDATFSNPGFQAQKDGVRWRASDFQANLNAGSFVIEGYSPFEIVSLKTSSIEPGVYTLGTGTSNTASYTFDADGLTSTYMTGTGIGDGQITIEKFEEGTVTGKFYFNARSTTDTTIVNFQRGVFYKIPVVSAP